MRLFIKSCCAILGLIGHLIADFFRLIRGVWKLSKLDAPVVSIFGGAKLLQDHPYAVKARQLAEKLMDHDISVITGGGPGIMEAANCGAFKKEKKRKAKSIGISVHGLPKEEKNQCSDDYISTHYFFARKWLLSRYSNAFAVFPGGYGTLDELFQVLTLMQTGKLKRVPVVLFEKEYWNSLVDWIKKAQKEGLILKEDADLVFVTDDIDEALKHLHKYCQHALMSE